MTDDKVKDEDKLGELISHPKVVDIYTVLNFAFYFTKYVEKLPNHLARYFHFTLRFFDLRTKQI